MGFAGVVIFFVAGALAVLFLFCLEANRSADKAVLGLLGLGFLTSTALALLGGMVWTYDAITRSQPLNLRELFPHSTALLYLTVLTLLMVAWLWSLRGLFNKVGALACLYALLVAWGLVPDPAQSDQPWALLVMVALIALRLLTQAAA